MDDERLRRQLDFAVTIDAEKQVKRMTHITGDRRRENDAEHAWHMTVMAYLLREYADDEIDLARTLIMCATHDLVEIYAGDTYAYDTSGQLTAHERESAAAERLFSLLPEDQAEEFRGLWEEFERNETPEAHFARAMDNVQPMILNDANGGADWRERGVSRSMPASRNALTRMGSSVLADHIDRILDHHVELGNLKP